MQDRFGRRRAQGWLRAGAFVVVALLSMGAEGADDAKEEVAPSGTIEIKQYQAAFIASGQVGGGTLSYEGTEYEFSIGGLGIGGIGVSSIDATGEVYHLDDVSKFAGVYGQARAGIVVTDKSAGGLWLKNPNGVYIRLEAKRDGVMLALGADGIYIKMK
jgi:hypothetical protein